MQIIALLLVGILMVQQFPLDGRAWINNDHRSCAGEECHCVDHWCTCDHCAHEDPSNGSSDQKNDDPRFVPCHGSSELPALIFSIDKTTSPDLAQLTVSFPRDAPLVSPPAATFVLLPDDIFHPPRLQRSGIRHA